MEPGGAGGKATLDHYWGIIFAYTFLYEVVYSLFFSSVQKNNIITDNLISKQIIFNIKALFREIILLFVKGRVAQNDLFTF
jgi:hypothetical protein